MLKSNGKGFEIPGVLWRREPARERLPLVLDSPHSGSVYPDDFGFCCPLPVLRRAEDAYVDELYELAPALGATLIGALFPRSYLDPNRAPDDLDPGMLAGPLPPSFKPRPVTRVGLVRRHARPGVPIYDRKLSPDDVLARIERYHAPYHQVLNETCDRLHAEFGAVWHINCHSMPSNGSPRDEHGDFVLGDRDGTCMEWFSFVILALRSVDEGQIVEAGGHVGMRWAKDLLTQGESSLVEGFCSGIATLHPIDLSKIIQTRGDTGVIGLEGLLT